MEYWIVFLIIGAMVAYLLWSKKEGYGQMKHIVKIPFTNCVDICDQYYKDCLAKQGDESGWCEARFKDACTYECYYSNYHRLQ